MRKDKKNRTVPLVFGALTLLGAVAWTSGVIVIGLAAVALWGPIATAAGRAAREIPPAGVTPRSTGALRQPEAQ